DLRLSRCPTLTATVPAVLPRSWCFLCATPLHPIVLSRNGKTGGQARRRAAKQIVRFGFSRSFPDERFLGHQLRVQQTSLPTRRNGCNDHPLLNPLGVSARERESFSARHPGSGRNPMGYTRTPDDLSRTRDLGVE